MCLEKYLSRLSLKVDYLFYHQVACCSAIRNIVSRSAELKPAFIGLDIEDLLNAVKERQPSTEDAVKAALRDLGLKVVLKEEWKGGVVRQK